VQSGARDSHSEVGVTSRCFSSNGYESSKNIVSKQPLYDALLIGNIVLNVSKDEEVLE
jgi:hypothetical protein